MVIAVASNFWREFCVTIAAPEWVDDPRFASLGARQRNQGTLDALLERRFRARSASEWEALLAGRGVPVGKVNTIAEALLHPQASARRMLTALYDPDGNAVEVAASPIHFAREAAPTQRLPSAKGADSAAILSDVLRYDAARIAALRDARVIERLKI